MNNSTILILGNYPPPYGGVPHHIKLFSNHLSNKGNKVFIVAGGNGKNIKKGNIEVRKSNFFKKIYYLVFSTFKPKFINILIKNGFKIKNLKYFLRLNIFFNISESIIRQNKIDIILSYNLYYYSPIAYELNKIYKIPYIVNVFGEINKLEELMNNKSYYLDILNNSKQNISCSIHCAKSIDLLTKRNIIPYKSILYGIDMNIFNAERINYTKKEKIGFFGRIDTEMGVDIFQKIIIKMSDLNIKYLIAGQKGNYYQNIEDFKLNSDFQIETYYNVETNKLAALYKECKIVIVPTRGLRTCSSLATMEAMSCGCVVLGHNIGGIPELIIPETGILINFEDIEMFVINIKKLLINQDELNKRISNSMEYAKNHFSQETMCENFTKIISL